LHLLLSVNWAGGGCCLPATVGIVFNGLLAERCLLVAAWATFLLDVVLNVVVIG